MVKLQLFQTNSIFTPIFKMLVRTMLSILEWIPIKKGTLAAAFQSGSLLFAKIKTIFMEISTRNPLKYKMEKRHAYCINISYCIKNHVTCY